MSTTRRTNNLVIKTEPSSSGVIIKTEPGSSGVIIKTEPGSSPGRLSSFKLPRDLTLGGQSTRKASSKKYTPNLSVVRTKKENVQLPAEKTSRPIGKGRVEKHKHDNKKNLNRGLSNYIQTKGIFSDGVVGGPKRTSSHSYSTKENDSGSSSIERPRLNLKKEIKIDKDEEKLKIEHLLQVDDGEYTDDPATLENMPNTLPIMSKGKNILRIKKEEKKDVSHVNGVSIKSEPMDTDQILKEDHNMTHFKIKSEGISNDCHYLFTRKQPTLFLLQLPDSLPGQGALEESTTSKEHDPRSSDNKTSEINLADNLCTLSNLNEGKIGKIVLYKSGKTQLVLGETKLDMDLGTQSTFLQEVMSVKVNKELKIGEMINLGPIEAKIITTPDWTGLM